MRCCCCCVLVCHQHGKWEMRLYYGTYHSMYDDVVCARVCNSPSATAICGNHNDREDPTPYFSNHYIII